MINSWNKGSKLVGIDHKFKFGRMIPTNYNSWHRGCIDNKFEKDKFAPTAYNFLLYYGNGYESEFPDLDFSELEKKNIFGI